MSTVNGMSTGSGMRTVTVVGASLAGLYAARELRAQGFDGRLVIVGEEPHRPYDRPPLSKDFLLGKAGEDQLALSDVDETLELGAEWMFGVRARGLDARSHRPPGERPHGVHGRGRHRHRGERPPAARPRPHRRARSGPWTTRAPCVPNCCAGRGAWS